MGSTMRASTIWREVLDETIVVIVSDHGEHLGEHGMFDHRWSVHQELLAVPLVIRYPKALHPARVDAPVSTQQILPTLCRLAAVSCPDGLPVTSLTQAAPEGVFAELIQPTPRLPPIRKAYPELDPGRWRMRYHVLVEGDYKLVRQSDATKRLYNLAQDPGEGVDLAQQEPERTRRMLERVKAWQQGLDRYRPDLRSETDEPNNALEPDPDTLEQLRQLGYVADEESP